MAILAECPRCHRKQANKNKFCPGCGNDLDKSKRSKKVKYWITYRLPGGKQRRELIGYSVEEARDAEGKRRGQKREGRIFDILPDVFTTYDELSQWYLNLEGVKELASYKRVAELITNFNKTFGHCVINNTMNVDLENYQLRGIKSGRAPRTVDYEISVVQTMVNKAFENRKISGDALLTFKSLNKMLKKNANARKITTSVDEYVRLLQSAKVHLKLILITAYNTGMRKGEIRKLKWKHIDWQNMFIRRPARITKENKDKDIPINRNVGNVLNSLKPSGPKVVDSAYHDFIFTYHNNPITGKDALKKSFQTACEKAKIPYGRNRKNGVVFHDIRRSVKTNMLAAGVKKAYRDRIFGHRPQDMDAHYIMPSEEDLTQAMELYTKWLDEKMGVVSKFGQHLVNTSE